MQVKNRFPVKIQSIIGLIFIFGIILMGCETKNPSPVFNENASYADDPVVQSINPPDSAIAGVDLVTINGQNFADSVDANTVYFNSVEASVVSATPTQLVVSLPHVPEIAGDSVEVLVDVDGSLQFAKYKYNVRMAVKPLVTDLGPQDELHGIALDVQNNIFAVTGIDLIKEYDSAGLFLNVYSWMSTIVNENMIYAPEGRLYTGGKLGRTFFIFAITFSPDTSYSTNLVNVSSNPIDYDFDPNGTLWAALPTKVIKVTGTATDNPTSTDLASYSGMSLLSLRYYDGQLYLLASDGGQLGVWVSDTTSGNVTQLADLSGLSSENFKAYDMELDNQGGIFVSTNLDTPLQYITPVERTVKPYYAGLFPTSPMKALIWKNGGHYLLATATDPDEGTPVIYQIDTKTLTGATRWGRELSME